MIHTYTPLPMLHLTVSETAQTTFYRSRSLQQGERSNQGHGVAHLSTNVIPKHQLPTPYGL